MDDDLKTLCGIVLILVIGFSVMVGGVALLGYFGCHAKWDRAGMSEVAWGPIQGCMVLLPDGRWMPTDRLREMELPKVK